MTTEVTRSDPRRFGVPGPTSPATGAAFTLAGAMVDELRVVGLLGRGGMGTVYAARDTMLDRDVALKLIDVHTGDDNRHRRFLSEARALAKLEHPNVVRIHRAAISSHGQPYLVQELIRGSALDQLATPLEPRRACMLAIGIARGLAAAHSFGILHRDVKPSNVMVTGDGVVKLLDFGISELRSRDAEETPRTASLDTIVGTPRYLAPELWDGHLASARTDTYALGVVLHELLSGSTPYAHALDLQRAVTTGPEPPVLDDRAIPASLARLVARCIARNPTTRPTIDELIRRLEAIAGDLPTLSEGNPYPGLSAYEAALRADFHGRGAEIEIVLDRLRAHGVVTVTGDSGIGKSSLCRAGVLPAIVAGRAGDDRIWRSVVVTPGRRPLQALQRALALDVLPAPGSPPTAWTGALGVDAHHGVVVLVDQLEELLAVADPTEAAAAARAIAALADGTDGLRLVAVVRGDFLTRVGALAELGPTIMRNIHLLRPLDESSLREVVTGPARARGVAFADSATVDELIAPVLADPTTLPLLQFTLAALWERREDGGVPTVAVRAVGGVTSGFGGHADRVLGALSDGERAAARRIVLSVVDGRTRTSRERDELVAGDPVAPRVLEALVAGRILVARDQPGDAPTYTLVHDALIEGWPRLRGWLDDRVGERAVRSRLRLASDDWLRAGRPAARLWPRGALAETVRLDGLTATERAFVTAGRRAARSSRMIRIAALAAIPLAAALAWLVVEQTTRATRAAAIEAHRDVAHRELAVGRVALAGAAVARTAALAMFGSGPTAAAERQWTAAAAQVRDARAALGASATALETVLSLAPDDRGAQAGLADVIYEQALIAEANHDSITVAELLQRLARHDRGAVIARWRAPGALRVEVIGAVAIAVRSIDDREGRRVLGDVVAAAPSHELEASLRPGSYVVESRGADNSIVTAPVVVARGESLSVRFALPDGGDVPRGFVVVPPGRFLTGTRFDTLLRRDFLGATPERVVMTDGYLIAQHEVTFGEWIEFLRALPPEQRALRRPQTAASRVLAVRLEGADPYTLMMQPSEQAYRAVAGEPLVYPNRDRRARVIWERLPVSGVSFHDAEAYAAWLASTGRVPRARLCTEPEWERAARGADGRAYPHGDRLDADDANIDVTYGDQRAQAFGPDEVGAHPASNSPFGVADLAGNVWEWVRGDGGVAMLRGGGWLHGAVSALSANHDANPSTMRFAWAGVRICADLSAR